MVPKVRIIVQSSGLNGIFQGMKKLLWVDPYFPLVESGVAGSLSEAQFHQRGAGQMDERRGMQRARSKSHLQKLHCLIPNSEF